MNLFKGLLYLLDTTTPARPDGAPLHYGAATAADRFARPLGNRAASEDWFGPRAAANQEAFAAAALDERALGCC